LSPDPTVESVGYVIQVAILGLVAFTEVVATLVIATKVLLVLKEIQAEEVKKRMRFMTIYTSFVTLCLLALTILAGLIAGAADAVYAYKLGIAARVLEGVMIVLVSWSVRPPVIAKQFGSFMNT